MEISLNLLIKLENQEIWHKNGEHLKILLDSIKIHLVTCSGKWQQYNHKTDLESCGLFFAIICFILGL